MSCYDMLCMYIYIIYMCVCVCMPSGQNIRLLSSQDKRPLMRTFPEESNFTPIILWGISRVVVVRSADTGNEQLGLTDVTQMICNVSSLAGALRGAHMTYKYGRWHIGQRLFDIYSITLSISKRFSVESQQ